MRLNLAKKIMKKHLISGVMESGSEMSVIIDQTLTQDTTGTLAYLQFEKLNIPKVKTKLSASYVDHNMLQTGFENADDHRYLQEVAAKYGVFFSKPGNGICHQVHRERFGIPGQTLLGSDSHTQTCGGLGMLGIEGSGLDVAMAMAGQPFYLNMPKILGVYLTGKLKPWVSGKDVILEMLRLLTIKGGIGKIIEYYGPGVKSLSIHDRFTIANMGAELGAISSLFPSDQKTKEYLKAQTREKDWKKLLADENAKYDEELKLNLDELQPMIAQPQSPDNVVKVKDIEGIPISQVCIGSCANSAFHDLAIAAQILKDKKVHPNVSFTLTPGSKQVFEMISKAGILEIFISAGARILESACGPCIGMGSAPASNSVSLRSFNQNFEGKSGTTNAKVYLASTEVCTASAITGVISDPSRLNKRSIKVIEPKKYIINDNMIIPPPRKVDNIEIMRGPNIRPLPEFEPLQQLIAGKILIKVEDNITTDHIVPTGSKIFHLRSNIPAISEHVFVRIDPNFPRRAKDLQGGIIIGGNNYGQGSSREHAALAPRYLGVKAVLSKSFSRIHQGNLINFGILPLTFKEPSDYVYFSQGDDIEIPNIRSLIEKGDPLKVTNKTNGKHIHVNYNLTSRQKEIILAGGVLNLSKVRK
jgi:aconitate hydratase